MAEIILESRSLVFGAGDTKTIGAGSYIGILSADEAVTVKLYKNNTEISEDLTMYKGTAFSLADIQRLNGQFAFDAVRITSAVVQEVEYVIASGEYVDQRLNVLNAVEAQIVGGALNNADPPHVELVGGVANAATPAIVTPEYRDLKAHYGGLIGTGLVTVVAPAANVSGIKLQHVDMTYNAVSATRLMGKTSAPVGWNDGAARALASLVLAAGHAVRFSVCDSGEFLVPAGEGVYVQSSVGNGATVSISYEVL